MSGRILIDDLRAPVLTDDQRAFMRAAEENPVELTEEAVLAAASARAGLDDFGPDDFRSRLRVILAAVAGDDNATALVRSTIFNRTVAVAVNRLLAHDLLARHPEIHELEIRAPIVIAGLPRSGTTHLLGLLSADPRLRSLPYWEAVQPIPLPGEAPGPDGADPRYRRSAAGWERLQRLNPTMAAYHPMDPDHIHEDNELQMPDFASYYWEWLYPMPRWRDHYLSHDQVPHYEYARTLLKIMTWQDGVERRWVLKCPQHFEQLRAVMAVYPDATVVFTHRDPVASLQSIVTQMAYAMRTRVRTIDPDAYMEYWTDRVRRLLQAYVRDRDVVPAEQCVDVDFERFVADDVRTLKEVQQRAGLPADAAADGAIARYRDAHARGKHGSIDHDLRRDFGVDPEALRASFGFYADALAGSR